MDIVKAAEQDAISIMSLITECIDAMEKQGIFMWNKHYPNLETIETDIKNGDAYVLRDDSHCVAYVAINEQQSPEYDQIKWSTDGRKVLVIHRLSVHPAQQGKGIGRMFMKFIEEYAVQNQYSCIRLDAYSENAGALRLYDKMGYKRLGQVFFPFKALPFYCFEKALNE